MNHQKGRCMNRKMPLPPRPHPQTRQAGLAIKDLKAGENYEVIGYHTGDFTGRFDKQTTSHHGEFTVVAPPELFGEVIEVSHHVAHIRPA